MKYWEVITNKPVENFFMRFISTNTKIQTLLIISPFMSPLLNANISLDIIISKVSREKILTYVITRKPEDIYHQNAIDFFVKSDAENLDVGSVYPFKNKPCPKYL